MTNKTIENLRQSFTEYFTTKLACKIDKKLIDLFFDTITKPIHTFDGKDFNRFIDILRLIRFEDITVEKYFQPYKIATLVHCDYKQELIEFFENNTVYHDYIKITNCLDYDKLAIIILDTFWQKIADQIYWHANDIELI